MNTSIGNSNNLEETGSVAQLDQMQLLEQMVNRLDERFEQIGQKMEERFEQMEQMNQKIDERFEQMEKDIKKIFKNIKNIDGALEETDRRLKAKETFPSPPAYNSPQQTNTVTQGSVSNPKWGKRSIFG